MSAQGQGAPDYRHLKPLVLVGKVSLRGENRLTCFARDCGRVIVAPDYAWFFRRRTRGGLGVVIYCERCKGTAEFDPVFVIHYPEREEGAPGEPHPNPRPPAGAYPPPPPPPSPSRYLRAQEARNRPGVPQGRPRVGLWRPGTEACPP